jgi:hypothetical protein
MGARYDSRGCPIAFEAHASGYLHVIEVVWPANCGADEVQGVKHTDEREMPLYRERGIAIESTPACGALIGNADGPAAGLCQRDNARRYWHHASAYDP